MTETPFAGRNIVITRPREQASNLAQRISMLGGRAILFPLLEISPVPDTQTLRKQVTRLTDCDLAIFISPNAVRYGLEAIHRAGSLPPHIATVGQGSAQALRDAGIKQIIAPQHRFDSEALLALPQLHTVHGWKIAIFRGDEGRELLGDTLKARGAKVEYISCYQRRKAPSDIAALLDARPDALTVSSSEALGYLWDMLDDDGRKQMVSVPLFVPHARIAEKARQQGWQKIIQTGSGDDGTLSGLVAWATV